MIWSQRTENGLQKAVRGMLSEADLILAIGPILNRRGIVPVA